MQRALPLVWSAALLVPVAVQVQLFPYNYAYAAPYASGLGENDYWRVSYRELLPQVPRGDFVACYPHLSGDGETMRYLPSSGRPLAENASDCRTHPSSTLTPFDLAARTTTGSASRTPSSPFSTEGSGWAATVVSWVRSSGGATSNVR